MIECGFYHGDCMDYLKELPDKSIDLAIVDPPYGDALQNGGGTGTDLVSGSIGISRGGGGMANRNTTSVYRQGANCRKPDGTWGYPNRRGMVSEVRPDKKIIAWDVAPKQEYFEELFRVSRNQIIWGGNYFALPPTRCFLVWRKLTISESFSMAMAEYAWTSFNGNAKVFEHVPQDNTGARFHPTQKPVELYKWILKNYAKEGDLILDTHVGSASSLVACREMGFKYIGFEIDDDYYRMAKERLDAAEAQVNIFDFM